VVRVGQQLRFSFDFDAKLAPAAGLFGVTSRTASVDVDDLHLTVRFGPWRLSTPTSNVVSATRTGPYRWWKVAGPPHLSFADRGVTFATTTGHGLCLSFREPVPAIAPGRILRHPAATVTVAEPAALAEALGLPL
jgi:hypothetical protein